LYRQTLFDLLLKLYDSARLDEAKEAAVIQTVEPAVEPDRRSSPKRKLIALCGLCFGFLVGCAMALLEQLKGLPPVPIRHPQNRSML
jgi:tyrosine-protein kinase Etk/Wzc